MCGIAGIVGAIDPTLNDSIQSMLSAERHRGPDDSGTFVTEGTPGVAFGFRRLAIIDLTRDGHQPMVDHERGNVVVFNGEIYNYLEIRRRLEERGEHFRSQCDTEVLLRAYAHYGPDVLNQLRGMFAFAIYDERRQEVLLARDRLGIKPLYYASIRRPTGPAIVFASELRSLLASGLIPKRLNPAALRNYLWNGFVVGPQTIVRDISLLPPGTTLKVSVQSGKTTSQRYWSLGPRVPRSADAAVEELQSELLEATKQHLVSDVPLGIFLSGGIDSSAVAALAVKSGTRNIKTFHVGFEEAGFDESAYARRVAKALGTEHTEYQLTQAKFVGQLDDALDGLDQPTFDAINTYFVSRVVREAGFTVALAGTGGDELFGGYESFRALPRLMRAVGKLAGLPMSGVESALNAGLSLTFGRKGRVVPQTRWAKLGALLASQGDPLNLYQVLYGLYTKEFLNDLCPSGQPGDAGYGVTSEARAELEKATAGLSPAAATSAFELAMFIGERLLRDSDAASMAVSLELRVPLLDHRVVEAAQRVPEDVRFDPLGKKMLLRKMALSQLDPEIFERRKAGFVLPIAVWAKDRLANDIESVFSDRALVESVGLSSEALTRLWSSFRDGAPGMYWSRVWAPYVLLRWCRLHGVALQ
jgi:asparagine synthase (glutamine-hydrolysing)